MPHQINLLDASLQRQRQRLGSTTGLLALAATLAIALAASGGLKAFGTRTATQADVTERELAALQARAAAVGTAVPPALTAELERLRAAEASQQRIRAALDSGQAGVAQGYSGYLFALSRQTHEGLWLTRFDVSIDARSLELGGRMTDPLQLPGYLRRLKAEPLFNGRQFAQLSLKAIEPGEGARVTEFALRSAPAASASEFKP